MLPIPQRTKERISLYGDVHYVFSDKKKQQYTLLKPKPLFEQVVWFARIRTHYEPGVVLYGYKHIFLDKYKEQLCFPSPPNSFLTHTSLETIVSLIFNNFFSKKHRHCNDVLLQFYYTSTVDYRNGPSYFLEHSSQPNFLPQFNFDNVSKAQRSGLGLVLYPILSNMLRSEILHVKIKQNIIAYLTQLISKREDQEIVFEAMFFPFLADATNLFRDQLKQYTGDGFTNTRLEQISAFLQQFS